MDLQQKTRRFGAWVIVCALLLRLQATVTADHLAFFLAQPNIAKLLIYLETGRNVRFSLPPAKSHSAESAAPWTAPEALPVFLPEQVKTRCKHTAQETAVKHRAAKAG